MLTYPASIPLSTRSLTFLSELIRIQRMQRGNRWRRLDPGRQSLLVLAHLRNGDTYTRLASAFGVGVATIYRYIREALDPLAAAAPTLDQAVYQASRLLWVVLDGTLIPIDRVAEERPYYSGKHKRHGVNVQVLADIRSRLLWASSALPGAVHDLKAALSHGIPAALTKFEIACYADNAYRAAGPTIASGGRAERHSPVSQPPGRVTRPRCDSESRCVRAGPSRHPGTRPRRSGCQR
ncbi:IS5 family transposase [Rugosimonospora africana]|uniref:IS5 family transposase n=1 Tax=Rugosimonospora africana TaxID=556532 RepID=A0A8J3QVE2_9ACTN|nr:IS5 family transposase [Rugosimonospora africana]